MAVGIVMMLVTVLGTRCSVVGALCSVYGVHCSVLGDRCSVIGDRCSRVRARLLFQLFMIFFRIENIDFIITIILQKVPNR